MSGLNDGFRFFGKSEITLPRTRQNIDFSEKIQTVTFFSFFVRSGRKHTEQTIFNFWFFLNSQDFPGLLIKFQDFWTGSKVWFLLGPLLISFHIRKVVYVYGWKKAPPWNLRKVRRGGSPGQNCFFFLKAKPDFFQIDVSLWRQNTKTMFLWQTDFIQFLAGGPPPWTWAKRFSLIPKKMKKTDNLQKFAIFFKLFSSWCHCLFF